MGLVTQKLHITPNAFGVLDGRSSSGTPVAPILGWGPVPDYLQNLQGTPFSVDISVYLSSTDSTDQVTFSLVSGTWPSGWSISSNGTVSYDGSDIGVADVQIRATQSGTSADSNIFTIESIAVAQADVLAPTIPTGLAVTSKTTTTISVSCDAPADISASDAVPYSGLKEVRFFKGGVLDGVASTSAGLSLRLSKVDLIGSTTGSSGRSFTPGHYTAFQDSQVWSGTPYNGGTYTGLPNTNVSDTGPITSDTAGVVMRHRWSVLQSASNTYDMSPITADLAQIATVNAKLPAGHAPLAYFVLVEVRTFTGVDTWDNPMPAHLVSVADGGTGSTTYASTFASGWQGWRWHDTVKAEFQKLVQKIGDTFNNSTGNNIYFAGIGTQETSNGSTTAGGYSVPSYVQALKDEGTYIANACPTGRHLWYFNFIHAGGISDLLEVAAFLQPLGAILGGPDLVTSGSILTSCYPNYTKYHNGTGGVPAAGPTFCSVQQSEWSGGVTGAPANPEDMRNLYNYATSSHAYTGTSVIDGSALANYTSTGILNLDMIVWNYVTSSQTGNGNQKFNPDATTIIHDHPTFGTFDAGTGSSGATFDFYISTTGSDANAGTLAAPWAITSLSMTTRNTHNVANCQSTSGKRVGIIAGTYNVASLLPGDKVIGALDFVGGSALASTYIASCDTSGVYSARAAIITAKNGSGQYFNGLTGVPNAAGPVIAHNGQYPRSYTTGYLTIDGLVVRGFTYKGIRIGNGSSGDGPSLLPGIRVVNCEINDSNGTGLTTDNMCALWIDSTVGAYIGNNYIHDCIGPSGSTNADHINAIIFWGSNSAGPTTGGVIEYNTIVNAGNIFGKEINICNTEIRFNYQDTSIYTANAFGSQDWTGYNTAGLSGTTKIHHNIFVGTGRGIVAYPTLTYSGGITTAFEIYNNTIVLKAGAMTFEYLHVSGMASAAGLLKCYNNIATGPVDGAGRKSFAVNAKAIGTWDYNMWLPSGMTWSVTPETLGDVQDAATTLGSFQSKIVANGGIANVDSHGVAATPSFVATTGATKYQLTPATAGSATGSSPGSTDGTTGGTATDMGAWGNGTPSRIGADFAP